MKIAEAKQPAASKQLLQNRLVTELKGVGDNLANKLTKLHIVTLQDLVFHLPLRYQDRTRVTPLGAVQPNQEVVIEGEIRGCDIVYGKRRSMLAILQDTTGRISLRFYHFSNAQKERLLPGTKLRCYGEARRGAGGLEIYHPEYKFLDETTTQLEQTLTPVYPATEGISQLRLRGLIQQALTLITEENLPELLDAALLKRFNQTALVDALYYLHAPPKDALLEMLLEGEHPYQQRLAFEELLAHHLTLLKVREETQRLLADRLDLPAEKKRIFLAHLPFTLTRAQQRVCNEISSDLAQPLPMLRLVQGDVGSGKTIVAALAALHAVSHGKQVALMAPTEILAEQHRINFSKWFAPLDVMVVSLMGKQKAAEKRDALKKIVSGEAGIVIGTHALIQSPVEFNSLSLMIIDEQHRFGVHQRLALREKSNSEKHFPHQLIMTATPIPRTLAMSAYADLDCSVIDELPPGRTPIETVVVSQQRRDQVVARVHEACRVGRQAYWVCTLIEESDVLEAQAAEATAATLATALPNVRVGLLHGRIKGPEKEAIMTAFKSGELDLLVATTVIEVGVDVPNASLMIIENPERLGLAQLHQLRGRVGRGKAASHCVLLYGAPLGQTAKARLEVMRQSNDGFVIAEKDLEIRGPGEVLGTRQTGEMQFKIANLQRDAELLQPVREAAAAIQGAALNNSVTLSLTSRWLGQNELYANV